MLVSSPSPKPRWVEIEQGLCGTAAMMALAARPPWRTSKDRHNKAIQIIRDVAGWGFFDQHNHEHPQAPRRGNRSREDRIASLDRVFSDFKKAVDAGRIFRSSLIATDLAGEAAELTISFKTEGGGRIPLHVPAKTHGDAIKDECASESSRRSRREIDLPGVRQDVWDRWLPTIHISAAFSLIFDSNEARLGRSVRWDSLCRSLLFQEGNEHICAAAVWWAGELEREAIEQKFFRRNQLISVRVGGGFS